MGRNGTFTRIWETHHKQDYPLTFSVWYNLKGRQYHQHYKNRELDPELVACFETFLNEVGVRPSKDYSLDRIDNSKGYIKGNLRWATLNEQQRNRTTNHTYQGKCITEWSEISGIPAETIGRRIRKNGWSYERAIWTPVQKR